MFEIVHDLMSDIPFKDLIKVENLCENSDQ